MARIVIKRASGETEYAELTTDKALAGNDRLAVEKAGAVYYAKLDKGISTHMYVIKPDGRKLYVQKEVKFVWKYDLTKNEDGMIIPRTGKYKMYIDATETTWDDYVGHSFVTISVDVFTKGTKVIGGSYIQSQRGKKYYLYEDMRDCGDEGCAGTVSRITCIEYID